MNRLSVLLMLLLLLTGVSAPVLVYIHGSVRFRERQSQIFTQGAGLREVRKSVAHQASRNTLTNIFSQLSSAEVRELARLRNEIRQLHETLKKREKLLREKQMIEQAMQNQLQGEEPENPLALLREELPLRRARLAALQQWLEQNPEEKIPELQFLSEYSWIKSADTKRVADEDFEMWMSSQRANAQAKFSEMARLALKAYAEANDGKFPLGVAQLKPFFSQPIDDAILERYQIVSTKTLPAYFAEVGGDWAITQKAPINPRLDNRFSIGLKGSNARFVGGPWNGIP